MDSTDLYLIKESVKMTQSPEQLWLENLMIITRNYKGSDDLKTLFLNIVLTFSEKEISKALSDQDEQIWDQETFTTLFTEELVKSTQNGITDRFVTLNIAALKQGLRQKQLTLDTFIEQSFKQILDVKSGYLNLLKTFIIQKDIPILILSKDTFLIAKESGITVLSDILMSINRSRVITLTYDYATYAFKITLNTMSLDTFLEGIDQDNIFIMNDLLDQLSHSLSELPHPLIRIDETYLYTYKRGTGEERSVYYLIHTLERINRVFHRVYYKQIRIINKQTIENINTLIIQLDPYHVLHEKIYNKLKGVIL